MLENARRGRQARNFTTNVPKILVVIEMGILEHPSNFQNCIKKTNKIPEYARDFKKEYLSIIGINREFRYFVEHIHESPIGLI